MPGERPPLVLFLGFAAVVLGLLSLSLGMWTLLDEWSFRGETAVVLGEITHHERGRALGAFLPRAMYRFEAPPGSGNWFGSGHYRNIPTGERRRAEEGLIQVQYRVGFPAHNRPLRPGRRARVTGGTFLLFGLGAALWGIRNMVVFFGGEPGWRASDPPRRR
jgi:hypothetical protein